MLPIGHNVNGLNHGDSNGHGNGQSNGHGHGDHAVEQLDPRAKRTRQLLLDAFVSLSKEKDFSAITIQDIAERATVNRATFYAHFEDKYALMNYYVRVSYGTKIHEGMGMNCRFSPQNLRSLIVTTCEYLDETHHTCNAQSLRMAPQLRTQMQLLLYEMLLRWLAAYSIPAGAQQPPLEQIAGTLSWTIFGAAIQWVTGDKKQRPDEMAKAVVDLLIGGLGRYVDFPSAG